MSIQIPPESSGKIVDTTTIASKERQIVQVEGIGAAGTSVIVAPPANGFVTTSISKAQFDAGTIRAIIDCQDAAQVWGRVYGTFVASWQPEVNATTDNLLWTKVDIWELESRRYFSTSSGGRVFLFSDLMGAAFASVKITSMTSGTMSIDLRTLRSNPINPRMVSYPEEVLADGYGILTAPTAGTVIASINNPGEGVYEIEVVGYYKGATTPLAADDSNIGLYSGGALIGRVPMPRSLNERGSRLYKYVDVTSSTNDLEVKAIGNATSLVIYEVLLSAQRLF